LSQRPCNFCQATEARLVLRGYGFDRSSETFDLHECTTCGLVRVEPLLAPEQLAEYYRTDYYGSPEAKFTGPMEALVRRGQRLRAQALLRRLSTKGRPRVLDIGCGRGLFLRALHELGAHGVGTELPGFAFTSDAQGPDLVHARAEALPFGAETFDAVSIWHVLEHTTDPAAVLRGAARVLKPGGILALAVPNFGSWQARLFGRHWFHLDLPRHLYHFRPAPLRRFQAEQGLEVIEQRTQAWDQNPYGFLQSCLNAVYWRSAPNGLYQFLKKHKGARPGPARLAGYTLLGGAALPLALLENIVAPWLQRGATLILHARRNRQG
jgi:2-polyprenyl-3-methyl-5-hydroxy-6-metoxy-1,4-benzoquinol methylase